MTGKNKKILLLVGNWKWDIYEEALARGFSAAGWDVIPFRTVEFLPQGRLLSQLRRLRTKWTCKDLNHALLQTVKEIRPNMMIFVRCDEIVPETIQAIKTTSPDIFLIAYHNDNPFVGIFRRFLMRQYLNSLFIVDLTLVYRPGDIQLAFKERAKHVEVLLPWFIRERHKPIPGGETNDVIYIGHFETDGRENILNMLYNATIKVRIYGTDWQGAQLRNPWMAGQDIRLVWGEEYAALLSNAKIALVFLSAKNRDVYTRRCFEIPACGSLLMAPRTKELEQLFKDGEEAVFWNSPEDLAAKVKYYLDNETERLKIAAAGYKRVSKDKHDEFGRALEIISLYEKYR